MGGHLGNVTAGGVAIIFYLAMVSAVHIHSGLYCLHGMMFRGCNLWIRQSPVQCDFVCADAWRGESGI